MRIDLDTRLTLAFLIAWGVIIGEIVVGLFGGPVNSTIIATCGSTIIATLGVGAVVGAARGDPQDEGQKKDETP